MLSFITIFTLCMWFPHISIDFVFVKLKIFFLNIVLHIREIHADSRDIYGQGPCTDSQIMPPTVSVELLIRLI